MEDFDTLYDEACSRVDELTAAIQKQAAEIVELTTRISNLRLGNVVLAEKLSQLMIAFAKAEIKKEGKDVG
jgi:hypothetical protein